MVVHLTSMSDYTHFSVGSKSKGITRMTPTITATAVAKGRKKSSINLSTTVQTEAPGVA